MSKTVKKIIINDLEDSGGFINLAAGTIPLGIEQASGVTVDAYLILLTDTSAPADVPYRFLIVETGTTLSDPPPAYLGSYKGQFASMHVFWSKP